MSRNRKTTQVSGRLAFTALLVLIMGIGLYQILNEFFEGISLKHDIPTFDIGIAVLTEVAVLWIVAVIVILIILVLLLPREVKIIQRRNNRRK